MISLPPHFRNGFYAGLLAAVIAGLYLNSLWQPQRQVELHSAHLLSQIEKKNWSVIRDFLGENYRDQWGNDRALLAERLREVFGALRNVRIEAHDPITRVEDRDGYWHSKITISGDSGEWALVIKERVNSLGQAFELHWHRQSRKPWDWKLVGVSNPALEVPVSGD